MKKLLFMALPLVVFSGMANAALTSCTSQGSWTLAQLEALSGGCEIGDKIFSGWGGTFTGTDAGDTFSFSGPTGPVTGPSYAMNLNAAGAALGSPLAFTYTVAVDQSQVAAGNTAAITRITGGMQDNGNTIANLAKVLNGLGCTVTVTDNGAGQIQANPCNINATSVTIAETYTQTGSNNNGGVSTVTGFGNTFTQTLTNTTGVPEPMSMLLFGSGLLACGFIGRKRMARK